MVRRSTLAYPQLQYVSNVIILYYNIRQKNIMTTRRLLGNEILTKLYTYTRTKRMT